MKRIIDTIFRILLFAQLGFIAACQHSSVTTEDVRAEQYDVTCSRAIQDGENLDFILQEMCIGGNERYKIAMSLQEYLDMRNCMPEDTIIVMKDMKGSFVRLEYVKEPFLRYTVTKVDTGFLTERIEFMPSIVYCTLKGTVTSSLYQSIVNLGESPELVFDFADIFAWVIDFLTEVQNGDEFEIIIEREYFHNRHIRDRKVYAASYRGAIGTYHAFYYMDPDGREDYYDEIGNSLRKQLLRTPLQYRRISSHFSLARLHPILRIRRPHYGVDFAAPRGTPVSTVGDGHVVFAGWKGGYGKLIIINHPNSFKTYYGHLSRIQKGVVTGAKVNQGDVIGYVGSTGLSTGPHLHFGIKNYGKWINPLKVDLPPAEPVNEKYKKQYLIKMQIMMDALTGQ